MDLEAIKAIVPKHHGMFFTPTIHHKAEGATLPENNRQPPNFTVWISGAGRGIGRDIAIAYARAGATNIIISSRTKSDLVTLEPEVKNKAVHPNVRVLAKVADTAIDAQVKELTEQIWASFGRLDAVVANAAISSSHIAGHDGKLKMPSGITEDDDFGKVMMTNVAGTQLVAKYTIPLLVKTDDGAKAFVAMSSICAHYVNTRTMPASYSVSKAAVTRMVEIIASEHGKEGVVAYALHPGSYKTSMTSTFTLTQLGDWWDTVLVDDPSLCGGFLTWLTKEKRDWLNGRYIAAPWDVETLESMKDDIVNGDKLKLKMVV